MSSYVMQQHAISSNYETGSKTVLLMQIRLKLSFIPSLLFSSFYIKIFHIMLFYSFYSYCGTNLVIDI